MFMTQLKFSLPMTFAEIMSPRFFHVFCSQHRNNVSFQNIFSSFYSWKDRNRRKNMWVNIMMPVSRCGSRGHTSIFFTSKRQMCKKSHSYLFALNSAVTQTQKSQLRQHDLHAEWCLRRFLHHVCWTQDRSQAEWKPKLSLGSKIKSQLLLWKVFVSKIRQRFHNFDLQRRRNGLNLDYLLKNIHT